MSRDVWKINTLDLVRGDTVRISQQLTPAQADLVELRSALWFTVKAQLDDSDEDAIIQIQEGVGLVRLNGAQPSNPSWGSVTIEEATGQPVPGFVTTIQLVIQASATQLLTSWNSYLYHDFQIRKDGGIVTVGAGRTYIIRDRTRAI